MRYRPVPEGSPLRPLASTLAALDFAVSWIIVGLMAVMVAVVSAQVFMRYALNSSIGWADELSRLTFVWSIFLAIPLGVRAGAHIGVEMLTAKLPKPLRGGLARAMALVGAALLALVAWEAGAVAVEQWDEQMASMDTSASLFLGPLVIGGVHGALHLLWIALTGEARLVQELAKDLA